MESRTQNFEFEQDLKKARQVRVPAKRILSFPERSMTCFRNCPHALFGTPLMQIKARQESRSERTLFGIAVVAAYAQGFL